MGLVSIARAKAAPTAAAANTAAAGPRRQASGLPADKEFVATLAKGLAVLEAFDHEHASMTLSEAANAADLSRAAARRILRTLTQLGYVDQDGRNFSLSPNILRLGFAYVASRHWIERALPLMRALSEQTSESCSASILQGTEIVYVARVQTTRIMSGAVTVGSRLPAFHTAMGRIQLGFLDDSEIWRRLNAARIEPLTPYTITEPQALFDRIKADREQGFSLVDEELERGLRAMALPILDRQGQAIAALNMSTHASRTTRNEMRDRFLPQLKSLAEQISLFVA